VTLNLDLKVTGFTADALDISCAQLMWDLFAIAKFLLCISYFIFLIINNFVLRKMTLTKNSV